MPEREGLPSGNTRSGNSVRNGCYREFLLPFIDTANASQRLEHAYEEARVYLVESQADRCGVVA